MDQSQPQRAVIYCRVSTQEQADSGTSLTSQAEACRRYAQLHGMSVVTEYSDDVSGAELNRPGLNALLDMVAAGGVEAVVVYTSDRLSRKLAHNIILRETLLKAKVELHFVSRGKLDDNAYGQFGANIEAAVAELEKSLIVERTSRGRRAKVRSGKWVGTSHPYGYRRIGERRDAVLEIDEAKAAVVRRIFEMYTGAPPLSMLQIATTLSREEVPTPSDNNYRAAPGWNEVSIRKILNNRSYIGEFHYGDSVAYLPHLAIVEPDVFAQVQVRRERNSQFSKRNRKYDYLLAGGHLRCSCGRTMAGQIVGNAHTNIYFYYSCTTRREAYRHQCNEKSVRRELADQLVWDWIHALLTDEETLLAGVKAAQERNQQSRVDVSEQVSRVETSINATDKKLARLTGLIAQTDDAVVTTALMGEMKGIAKDKAQLENELVRLRAAATENARGEGQISDVLIIATQLRQLLDVANFDIKRQLLERLNVRVQVQHDEEGNRLLVASCAISTNVVIDPTPC